MEGALDEANAELRTIMKRLWKRSATDKVHYFAYGNINILWLNFYICSIVKYNHYAVIFMLKVLDKLLPPPGEGIDDEIAVGKFYATVLIQVILSLCIMSIL